MKLVSKKEISWAKERGEGAGIVIAIVEHEGKQFEFTKQVNGSDCTPSYSFSRMEISEEVAFANWSKLVSFCK